MDNKVKWSKRSILNNSNRVISRNHYSISINDILKDLGENWEDKFIETHLKDEYMDKIRKDHVIITALYNSKVYLESITVFGIHLSGKPANTMAENVIHSRVYKVIMGYDTLTEEDVYIINDIFMHAKNSKDLNDKLYEIVLRTKSYCSLSDTEEEDFWRNILSEVYIHYAKDVIEYYEWIGSVELSSYERYMSHIIMSKGKLDIKFTMSKEVVLVTLRNKDIYFTMDRKIVHSKLTEAYEAGLSLLDILVTKVGSMEYDIKNYGEVRYDLRKYKQPSEYTTMEGMNSVIYNEMLDFQVLCYDVEKMYSYYYDTTKSKLWVQRIHVCGGLNHSSFYVENLTDKYEHIALKTLTGIVLKDLLESKIDLKDVKPVSSLKLPVRVLNILRNNDIYTTLELSLLDKAYLVSLKGISENTYEKNLSQHILKPKYNAEY